MRRTGLTSVSPILVLHSVLTGQVNDESFNVPISFPVVQNDKQKIAEVQALIDSGAGGKFIDQNYARSLDLPTIPLRKPLKVLNVDGTPNKKGTIRHKVRLSITIGTRTKRHTLYVSGLGKQKIILGLPWLRDENPDINWKAGKLRWREDRKPEPPIEKPIERLKRLTKKKRQRLKKQKARRKPTLSTEPDEHTWMNRTVNRLDDDDNCLLEEIDSDDEELTPESFIISYINGELDDEPEEVWINAKLNNSQKFALEHDNKSPEQGIIPPEYYEYRDVFNEAIADRFPWSRPWDHKIETKPGFKPKSFRSYNLTPEEREQQEEFITEQLRKGYIRPSKSPMASPFFFVSKKDGKLRPTQDYQYINQWTIKNAYPLPLIPELMDQIEASSATSVIPPFLALSKV